jgi:hypothetical protein
MGIRLLVSKVSLHRICSRLEWHALAPTGTGFARVRCPAMTGSINVYGLRGRGAIGNL